METFRSRSDSIDNIRGSVLRSPSDAPEGGPARQRDDERVPGLAAGRPGQHHARPAAARRARLADHPEVFHGLTYLNIVSVEPTYFGRLWYLFINPLFCTLLYR